MSSRAHAHLALSVPILASPATITFMWIAWTEAGAVRWIALLVGLATIAGAFFVAARLRRYEREMSLMGRAASRLAGGELGYRFRRPVSRELIPLAGSLNDMAGQLERRIAEIESQRSEQQAVLQCMANGVLALDPDQRITNINLAAERLLGLSLGEDRAVGHLLHGVVRQPELHRLVADALANQEPARIEIRLTGAPRLIVQAVAEVITTPGGETSGVVLVLNDVTDIRRLESMRSDFAANVSHELRTPITNIKGYVETLQELDLDEADARNQAERFLETVRTSANRLAAIVEDTMALTKLEQVASERDLELDSCPVAMLMNNARVLLSDRARAKGIEIEIDAPEDLHLTAQTSMIDQALANLLGNAINYSPEGTTVRLRGSVVAGEVHLEVIDQGPGIAGEHLARVFERFYRVDRARSREAGGTGLGLAIVKHIAAVHGGRAEVDSEIGAGSTFRIVLPGRPDATG